MPPPIERAYVNPGPVQFSYNFVSRMLAKLDRKNDPFQKLREVSRLCGELQSQAASATNDKMMEIIIESLQIAVRTLHTVVQSGGTGGGLPPPLLGGGAPIVIKAEGFGGGGGGGGGEGGGSGGGGTWYGRAGERVGGQQHGAVPHAGESWGRSSDGAPLELGPPMAMTSSGYPVPHHNFSHNQDFHPSHGVLLGRTGASSSSGTESAAAGAGYPPVQSPSNAGDATFSGSAPPPFGGGASTSEVITPRPITPTCWLYKRDAPTLTLRLWLHDVRRGVSW